MRFAKKEHNLSSADKRWTFLQIHYSDRFTVLKAGVVEESFNIKCTGDLIHELQQKEQSDELQASEERTLRWCAQEQVLLLTSGKNEATAPMEDFVTRKVQYNTKAYKDKKSVEPINII